MCRVKENCTAKVTEHESIQKRRKKSYVNVGLLKHGFQVMAA
jgi:hypothetical protein